VGIGRLLLKFKIPFLILTQFFKRTTIIPITAATKRITNIIDPIMRKLVTDVITDPIVLIAVVAIAVISVPVVVFIAVKLISYSYEL
jgi:hypothetical protein